MKHYEKMHSCLHCHSYIDENVYTYSTNNYGYELCYTCQRSINSNNSTAEARELYLSLKRRGVPAELEKFDGHKTIDIAVVDARPSTCFKSQTSPFRSKANLPFISTRLSHFKNSKRANQRKA